VKGDAGAAEPTANGRPPRALPLPFDSQDSAGPAGSSSTEHTPIVRVHGRDKAAGAAALPDARLVILPGDRHMVATIDSISAASPAPGATAGAM